MRPPLISSGNQEAQAIGTAGNERFNEAAAN